MGAHLIDGEFQSDKYPSTPRGKVPLSVRDASAQDLLCEYARRHRSVDPEFSDDLEAALRIAGYASPAVPAGREMLHRVRRLVLDLRSLGDLHLSSAPRRDLGTAEVAETLLRLLTDHEAALDRLDRLDRGGAPTETPESVSDATKAVAELASVPVPAARLVDAVRTLARESAPDVDVVDEDLAWVLSRHGAGLEIATGTTDITVVGSPLAPVAMGLVAAEFGRVDPSDGPAVEKFFAELSSLDPEVQARVVDEVEGLDLASGVDPTARRDLESVGFDLAGRGASSRSEGTDVRARGPSIAGDEVLAAHVAYLAHLAQTRGKRRASLVAAAPDLTTRRRAERVCPGEICRFPSLPFRRSFSRVRLSVFAHPDVLGALRVHAVRVGYSDDLSIPGLGAPWVSDALDRFPGWAPVCSPSVPSRWIPALAFAGDGLWAELGGPVAPGGAVELTISSGDEVRRMVTLVVEVA